MRQSKTTLKELTAAYRAVLRYGILCNAIALGLAVATPAKAGVIGPDTTNNVFVLGDISLDGQHVANGEAAFAGRRMNEGGYFVQNEGVWVASDAQTEGAVYRYKNDFPQYKMVARSFDMSNSDTYVGPVTLTLRDVSNDDFAFNYQDSVNGDWTDVNLANLSPAITWNVAEDTLTTAGIPQPTAHTIAMFAHLDGDVEGAHAAGSLAFNNVAAVVDGATINATSIDINNGSTLQFVKQDTNLLNTSNRFYTLAADIDSDGKTTLNADTMNVAGSRFVVDEGASLTINPTTSATFSGSEFAGEGGAVYNSGTLTINGASFESNSSSDAGGAISNAATANMTLEDVDFVGNSGDYGGAILVRGTAEINGGSFENNTAQTGGGAVYLGTKANKGYHLTIDGTTFTDNTTRSIDQYKEGGGAIGSFSDLVVKNATFTHNGAIDDTSDGAGAVFMGSVSTNDISDTTFAQNWSATGGGAIGSRKFDKGNNSAATLDIDNVVFNHNTAATDGGAINNYLYNDANNDGYVKVANSTFTENEAAKGGAIYNHKGSGTDVKVNDAHQVGNMYLTDTTFTGNTANAQGGAIYNEGVLTFGDDIRFVENGAQAGGAIYNTADGSITIGDNVVFKDNTSMHSSVIGGGKPYGGSDIKNYGYVEIGDNAQFLRTEYKDALYSDHYDTGIYSMNGSTTKIGDNVLFKNISQAINTDSNNTVTIGDNATFDNNGSVITNFGGTHVIGDNATFKNSQFTVLVNNDGAGSITVGDNATLKNNYGDTGYGKNGALVANTKSGQTITFGDGLTVKDNNTNGSRLVQNVAGSTINFNGAATFENNTVAAGGVDIYNAGTLNFAAGAGKTISLAGGINGSAGALNITGAGLVDVSNTLKNQTVNVNNGELHLNNADLTGSTVAVAGGATLNSIDNTANNYAGLITLTNGANIALDADFNDGGTYDKYTITDGANVAVTQLNLLNALSGNVAARSLNVGANNKGNINVAAVADTVSAYTSTAKFGLAGNESNDGTISLVKTEDLVDGGLSLAVDDTAIKDQVLYQLTAGETLDTGKTISNTMGITGAGTDAGDAGVTLAADLTATDGATVEINNLKLAGTGAYNNAATAVTRINNSDVGVTFRNAGILYSDPTTYSDTLINTGIANVAGDTFASTGVLENYNVANLSQDGEDKVTFEAGAKITGSGVTNLVSGQTIFNGTANSNTVKVASGADFTGSLVGGTLDTHNSAIDNITGSFSGGNVVLDAKLGATNTIDTIAGNTGTIKEINILGTEYGTADSVELAIGDATLDENLQINGMNYYTSVTKDSEGNIVFDDKLINRSTLDADLGKFATAGEAVVHGANITDGTVALDKLATLDLSQFNNTNSGFITKSVDDLANYTTTSDLNTALGLKANAADVYTKTATDGLLAGKIDTSAIAGDVTIGGDTETSAAQVMSTKAFQNSIGGFLDSQNTWGSVQGFNGGIKIADAKNITFKVDGGSDQTLSAADVATFKGYATSKQDALSETQLAAVNSGITGDLVTSYNSVVSAVNNETTGLAATRTLASNNQTAINTLNGDEGAAGSVKTIAKGYADGAKTYAKDYADTLASNYTTTEAMNTALDLKANANDVYTKTATNDLLATKANAATTLAGYGITDAYTKDEIDTTLGSYATTASDTYALKTDFNSGGASLYSAHALYNNINGENGKSLLFNETDGGGAKFTHDDGTLSFVGVNNGGQNGLAAQIYATTASSNPVNQGARIDVSTGGMYYTVGHDTLENRMVKANEIVTRSTAVEGSYDSSANYDDDTIGAAIAANATNIATNTDAIALLNNNVDTAGSVLNSIKTTAKNATYDGDVTLGDAIAANATSIATNAGNITTLQGQMTTLNGDASTSGSVLNSIKTTAKNATYSGDVTLGEAIAANADAIAGKQTKLTSTSGNAGSGIAITDAGVISVSGITTSNIAANANIAKTQLSNEVQTLLGKAGTSLQSSDIGTTAATNLASAFNPSEDTIETWVGQNATKVANVGTTFTVFSEKLTEVESDLLSGTGSNEHSIAHALGATGTTTLVEQVQNLADARITTNAANATYNDTTIGGAIAANATSIATNAGNITTLQGQMTTLNGDASTSGSVLNSIKTTAKNATYDGDVTLGDAIAANATSIATNATNITTLQGQMTTLNGDENTDGSVANSIATALSGYATTANNTYALKTDFNSGGASLYSTNALYNNIVGENGKSLLFNETDGGGAKFTHDDGTWSFTGVNNGGADGIAAQIYAIDSTSTGGAAKQGARIDVTTGGMYYTVGNAAASDRLVKANEIVTRSTAVEGSYDSSANYAANTIGGAIAANASAIETLNGDVGTNGSVLNSIQANAAGATYNNTTSGLTATTLQGAIDEIVTAQGTALSGKQDTLIAGNGVNIASDGKTISVAAADSTITVGTDGIKVGTIGIDNIAADAIQSASDTTAYTNTRLASAGYVDEAIVNALAAPATPGSSGGVIAEAIAEATTMNSNSGSGSSQTTPTTYTNFDSDATVVEAVAALDTNIGKVHQLITQEGSTGPKTYNGTNATASKNVNNSGNYVGNLAVGTTIEDHLVSLDNAIGSLSSLNESNGVLDSSASVATNLNNLDAAIKSLSVSSGGAYAIEQANAYTDERVEKLDKNLSSGIASAIALTSVSASGVQKGEVAVSGGYGYYNGQSAAAFGAAMGLSNRWSVNAGAGVSNSDVSFRAGTTYKFKMF